MGPDSPATSPAPRRASSRLAPEPRSPYRSHCFRWRRRRSPAHIPFPRATFDGKGLAIESLNFGAITLPVDPVNSGTFALNAPVIAGRSNILLVGAASPAGGGAGVIRRAIPPGTTGLTIEVPEALEFIFPFDGTTGVDHDTLFLSTEFADGVYLFRFFGPLEAPNFVVITDDPVAQIPDLSAFGVSLPPSTTYSAFVTGVGPFADLEDFTGPTVRCRARS